MGVLKTSELLEFRRPEGVDVALFPGGTRDAASDQVLVRVDQLVVLQRQEHKVINVLFEEVYAALILHGALEVLVARVEDALRHQDLHDVEERRMAVQVEADLVEDEGLLRHELVLLGVEAHFVVASLQGVHAVLVSKLLISLLGLGGLVPGKLSQELARAGHVGVLFEVLRGDEEAA